MEQGKPLACRRFLQRWRKLIRLWSRSEAGHEKMKKPSFHNDVFVNRIRFIKQFPLLDSVGIQATNHRNFFYITSALHLIFIGRLRRDNHCKSIYLIRFFYRLSPLLIVPICWQFFIIKILVCFKWILLQCSAFDFKQRRQKISNFCF